MIAIYPIVEGQGEVRAVPQLFRRIAWEVCEKHNVHVLPPHRIPRNRMLSPDARDLKRAVELGVRKIYETGTTGFIVVLLDADDDCPAELGPSLLSKIVRADVMATVVVAKREYEAWFLAAAESLRDHRAVSGVAVAPADPESIRGAKEYLEQHVLERGKVYSATVDQPALTAVLGIEQARSAPSFDKLCRDLCRLLLAAGAKQ